MTRLRTACVPALLVLLLLLVLALAGTATGQEHIAV
jgi:hypothetical protein